jgi:selenocysteine-specific elongation factor
MGTAGHVDHGKTALIKALTNVDCDTHKEEKRRGITINLGFSCFKLSDQETIGIIDVPGHKDFVHTTVGGVSGIDFVLFVIAAESGIMPQTREHLSILEILKIKKGIIALTKIDLINEDLQTLVKEEINDFVKNSFLEKAPLVEVCSISGYGIDKLKNAIAKISLEVENREKGKIFRMNVDRFFSVKGFGNVATGTVVNGEIDISKPAFLLPGNGKELRIRRIEKYGKITDKIRAGDRAALNIVGIEKRDFEKGKIISDSTIEATKIIDADFTLFKDNTQLSLWSKIIFLSGTFECQARVHLINANSLMPEQNAIIQIHLDKACVLMNGDRYILRNSSSDQTLGGGSVIDAKPLHHRRRPEKLIDSLTKLAEGSICELIRIEVKKRRIPVEIDDITSNLNKPLEEILSFCSSKSLFDIAVYKDENSLILFEKNEDNKCWNLVLENIKAFHKRNPLISYGLSFDELKSKLGISDNLASIKYLYLLLKKVEKEGLIKKLGRTWIIFNHKATVPVFVEAEISWLEKVISNYKMQTPLMSEIKPQARKRGISDRDLSQYFHFLVRSGKLYQIENDYLYSKIVDKCRTILLNKLLSINEGLTVAEFRDLINANRKIALLLFSQYDSENIVKRNGNLRFITEKGKRMVHERIDDDI